MKWNTSRTTCTSGNALMIWLRTWQQLSMVMISGNGTPSLMHRRLMPSRTSFISAGEALWQNLCHANSIRIGCGAQIQVRTQAMIWLIWFMRLNTPPFSNLTCVPSLSTMVAFEVNLNVLSSDRVIKSIINWRSVSAVGWSKYSCLLTYKSL